MKLIKDLESASKTKRRLFFLLELLVNLAILSALVLLIKSYLISPFRVYGQSMCDTINFIDGKCEYEFGEYIIVDKFSYQNFFGWQLSKPKRGDIIVLHPPKSSHHQKEYYIKRIIGLPKEKIVLLNGNVYIFNKNHPDGFKLEEKYLSTKNQSRTQQQQFNLNTFEIPEGKYFVMGDNRIASTDSRSCFKPKFSNNCKDGSAFLSPSQIQGKAWISLWPLSKIRFIKSNEYPKNPEPAPEEAKKE